MSEVVLEQALVDLLNQHPRLTGNKATRGDYSILDSGINECAVVVPGTFNQVNREQNRVEVAWVLLIDLFERDIDKTSWANFGAFRDAIIDMLWNYFYLGQTEVEITEWQLSADNDPDKLASRNGGGQIIAQTLRLELTEIIDVTGGDFA